jgi:hypothetical protein
MLQTIGLLPPKGSATWTFSDPKPVDPHDTGYGTITTVTVTVDRLPLFTGGNTYIPSVITLSATGVSASNSAPPGGMAILNFYDQSMPPGHNHKSIRVPCYCATKEVVAAYGAMPITTAHNASKYLDAGVWQGEFPVARVGDIYANLNTPGCFIETEKALAGSPTPKYVPSVGGASNEIKVEGPLTW